MALRIRLNEPQLADLSTIRDLQGNALERVVEHLRGIEKKPLRPDALCSEVARVLPEPDDVAERVVRPTLSLYGLTAQGHWTVEDVLKGVRRSLEGESGWTPTQLQQWDSVAPAFGDLLSLPVVALVAKAIDLSYEYANLLRTTQILTDIRPLFNDDASDIDGAVVSYTLRISFDSADGDHGLSIALDESDVRTLAKQCERALVKAATARRIMTDRVGVPSIVSGETNDA